MCVCVCLRERDRQTDKERQREEIRQTHLQTSHVVAVSSSASAVLKSASREQSDVTTLLIQILTGDDKAVVVFVPPSLTGPNNGL